MATNKEQPSGIPPQPRAPAAHKIYDGEETSSERVSMALFYIFLAASIVLVFVFLFM